MVGDNPDADCSGAVRFGVNAVLVRTATGFDPRIDDLFALESVLREG
jgi:ribonucleotide monophosphatase NagD (HAD superfamily)